MKGRTVLQAKRFGTHRCNTNTSLSQATQSMVDYEVSSMVVVDNDNYLVGIITRADVLRAYLEHDDWETLTVERYMHREVEVVTPHTPLIEAARMLVDHKARQVVVVEEEENGKQRPVAIISATDLVYHMLKD